jgi:hypothetical protein
MTIETTNPCTDEDQPYREPVEDLYREARETYDDEPAEG